MVPVADDRQLGALVVRLGAELRDRDVDLEGAAADHAAGRLREPAEPLERLLAADVEPLARDVEADRAAAAHGGRLLARDDEGVDALRGLRGGRGSQQGQSYD